MYERQLSPVEIKTVETAVDRKFACDEGVSLQSFEKTENGVSVLARCAIDSLGVFDVELPLVCQDEK